MDQTDAILADAYPSIHRIASGLTGRPDLARGIVSLVLKAAMRETAGWQRLDEPIKWFWHYTVLTCRTATMHQSARQGDLLIDDGAARDPIYAGFIASLRRLPRQQMEAFILRFGENLDPRQLAVAMDCSVTASANHLEAAMHALATAVGPSAAECTATLERVYAALTPPEELHLRSVKRIQRRQGWLRLARAAGAVLAAAAVAGACLYGVSWLSK